MKELDQIGQRLSELEGQVKQWLITDLDAMDVLDAIKKDLDSVMDDIIGSENRLKIYGLRWHINDLEAKLGIDL